MKRVFARARSATRDARIGRRVAEEEGRRVSRGRGGAEPRGAVAGKARARESSGGAARDVRADRGARASSRRRSRMCRAIAIRGARTLTTSAVRAAVALRAATRATGATTRRAETVAAIVAGCVCDANVRCGVPRGDAPSRNPKTRPGNHCGPVTRFSRRAHSEQVDKRSARPALERCRAEKCQTEYPHEKADLYPNRQLSFRP